MVDTAMAKKPNRSFTPLGVLSSRQNTVARMNAVTTTVASRIRNSSGVRRVLVNARRASTHTSAHHGFAYVATLAVDAAAAAVPLSPVLVVAPDTSLPRAMLILMASLSGSDGLSWRPLAYVVERELDRVLAVGDRVAELREEQRQAGRRAVVHRPASGEEHETIDEADDAVARLVDGHDHDAAALRDALQHLHHHERAGGVEPGGGLVEEQDDGVVDDVDADGHPPALAAGHPAAPLVADDGVRRGAQAELVDELLHPGRLLGRGERPREPELGGVHERLGDGEHRVEEVVLHDVRRDDLEHAAAEGLPVERDGAAEAVPLDPVGERVDQRGLAGAARAEHGHDLP
ncbi:Os03g0282166, partial [Oryza sativa Japonica Group]